MAIDGIVEKLGKGADEASVRDEVLDRVVKPLDGCREFESEVRWVRWAVQ